MDSAAMEHSATWDALEVRARAVAPAHRLGWFLSLTRQGRDAELLGRARLAAHCRARVETELAAFAKDAAKLAAVSASASNFSQPAASPLAELAARRGTAARAGALELLARRGDALSEAERAAFRAAFETAADAQVASWRRRLVDRLLRSARYRRRGAALAAWAAHRLPAPRDAVPAGPYNDFAALDEMLRRVAAAAPEWAAEFFDVHAEMDSIARVYGELVPKR